jgi:hypothetical protein
MGIDSRNASTVSRAVDDFSAGFPQVCWNCLLRAMFISLSAIGIIE